MIINLLIGLPGSGKSTYLETKNGYIFDDMSQIKDGIEKLKQLMNQDINDDTKEFYIADVNFCDVNILNIAKQKISSLLQNKTITFKYIIFDANEEVAQNNVDYRNDGRYVKPTIKRFSKHMPILIEYIKNHYHIEQYEIIKSKKMLHVQKYKK